MRVLIACERSGIVRRAFTARGHYAVSCDMVGADDSPCLRHYCGDVRDIVDDGWDLMIAHPPCTHLAVSGARWFPEKRADGRQQDALDFVRLLMAAPIARICIENPVSVISSQIRKPDQIIQPWMFGHAEAKATCLWLKNLPRLRPTAMVERPARGYWDNQTPSGQNKLGPSPERATVRSRTYLGIADAMAEQWDEKHLDATNRAV